MALIKSFLFSIFILLGFSAFAQNIGPVFLKWKLKPGEIITYKTIMQEIDTANSKEISFDAMGKMIGDSAESTDFKRILREMRKDMQDDSTVTKLKEKKKNVIDIEMITANSKHSNSDTTNTDTGYRKFKTLMNKMSSGVMLRGAIHEDGTIESFYTKNDQKNLIAIFFELPGKPVKVGDSWSLGIHTIAMDQSFICDSSFNKDEVTVTKIADVNNDQIVTLKYDIIEYVKGDFIIPFGDQPTKTVMNVSYHAIADFSVKQGRWIKYEGVMSNISTGMMSVQTTSKYVLIPE